MEVYKGIHNPLNQTHVATHFCKANLCKCFCPFFYNCMSLAKVYQLADISGNVSQACCLFSLAKVNVCLIVSI